LLTQCRSCPISKAAPIRVAPPCFPQDITSSIRIKCAECKDFDLCPECFAQGRHVFPHKPNHPYRVMVSFPQFPPLRAHVCDHFPAQHHVTTPIFEEDWGADEELMLLEAIEQFGLGNWSDVAGHVGTKKKNECEDHYFAVFLTSATAPLPVLISPRYRQPHLQFSAGFEQAFAEAW
jgi:transcriptional adapter 2-alpha